MRNLTFLIAFLSSLIAAGQDVTRIEYYFDTDPGFGNGMTMPIVAAPDLTQNFTVPLNTVSEGFHVLYVRAKSNGLWSIPVSKPVFAQRQAQTTSITNIQHLEYFFDTDPGIGNGISIPLTAAPDLTRNFTVPLHTVSEGFHILYVRAKSDGSWSIPIAKTVFVQHHAQTTAAANLRKLEYFFDTDPGFGNGVQLAASGNNFDQLVVMDLSTLANGFHTFHIRSLDENGQWSHLYTKPFFVQQSGSAIVAIEYYFDDGTTTTPVRTYSNFTPGKDITLDFAAVLDGLLPNTTYTIHLAAINADNQRSTEVTHVFTTPAVLCDPLTPPVTTGASRCESGTVTLTATGATNTQSYNWYANTTDITPLASTSSNAFTTPVLNTTTSFYVSIVNGTCESNRTEVIATILSCNQPPEIIATEIIASAQAITEFDLNPFLTDPDNNLDLSTLRILTAPAHSIATLNGTTLRLDYSNSDYVGNETLLVEVCDLLGSCAQQTVTLSVVGELEIYNAVSPNNDLKNDFFYIRYIQLIPDARKNKVSIFNRWGARVFHITDYNETDRVFRGLSNNGTELPSGTYFYTIEFESGRKPILGYLTLKR